MAHLRDLILGLARTVHGNHNWCRLFKRGTSDQGLYSANSLKIHQLYLSICILCIIVFHLSPFFSSVRTPFLPLALCLQLLSASFSVNVARFYLLLAVEFLSCDELTIYAQVLRVHVLECRMTLDVPVLMQTRGCLANCVGFLIICFGSPNTEIVHFSEKQSTT